MRRHGWIEELCCPSSPMSTLECQREMRSLRQYPESQEGGLQRQDDAPHWGQNVWRRAKWQIGWPLLKSASGFQRLFPRAPSALQDVPRHQPHNDDTGFQVFELLNPEPLGEAANSVDATFWGGLFGKLPDKRSLGTFIEMLDPRTIIPKGREKVSQSAGSAELLPDRLKHLA